MESAGRAVVQAVLARLAPGDSVLVVCGPGNNGGDGLVVARHLHALGVPVRAALLSDRLSGDAGPQLARARKAGVPLEGKRWRAPASGVIVDALFGTGLARALSGDARACVRRIKAARSARPDAITVIAVDLPSGLSSDTGQVLGAAVAADATVTLGLPKLGLAFEPGRALAGRITVARIGIADSAPGVRLDAVLWTRAGAAAALPARPRDGHKGTFGHALLVAGSEGKTGAAALCAEGAARVGAGLVTLACPAGLNDILEAKVTEAMTAPLPDTGARQFAARPRTGSSRSRRRATRSASGPGSAATARRAGSCARSPSASICRSHSMRTAWSRSRASSSCSRAGARPPCSRRTRARRPRCSACARRRSTPTARGPRASSRRAADRWWC
jgi:NAD(P)H-hydrate epimerase